MNKTATVAIFGGIAAAVILGLFFTVKQSVQQLESSDAAADQVNNATTLETFVDDEATDKLIMAKNKAAYDAALADPRVAEYANSAFNIDSSFYPTEETGKDVDELYLRVLANRTVSGDWQTSQDRVYSGVVDIRVTLRGAAVESVEVTNVPDILETKTFTDREKAFISAAMANSEVKALISGKQNVFVFT
ncbi:MAG: hypothetical protein ACRD5H_05815, partial [Nitrososphaerales archaeon]